MSNKNCTTSSVVVVSLILSRKFWYRNITRMNTLTMRPLFSLFLLFRGLIFILLLTVGAMAACVLISPTMIFLAIPSRRVVRIRRSYVSFISGSFFSYASYLLIHYCGTKIFIYSNFANFLVDKGVLIISNHRTRIDWMFVGWCYSSLLGIISELRLILKNSLRSVPIYGWSMQLMLYIFLTRKKEKDVPHISRMLSYLLRTGPRPNILLFPEGTDLSPSNKQKSNAFAKEKGFDEFHFCLYPKPSGFLACLKSYRGLGAPLHDLTIAYKDYCPGQRTSEYDFLLGRFPPEVHICVSRYEIDELPEDRIAIEEWLNESFQKKEILLSSFYTNIITENQSKKKNVLITDNPKNPHLPAKATATTTASNVNTTLWPPLLLTSSSSSSSSPNSLNTTAVIGIALSAIIMMGLLQWSPVFRWLVAAMIIAFMAGGRVADGLDTLELVLHEYLLSD